MAEAALTVRSLTGVEMTLPIAGPGMRSYAFLIDWQIRLLGALGWLLIAVLARLLPSVAGRPLAHQLLIGGVVLALLTYLLYQPAAGILPRGCTPGLRTAGARIVTLEGTTPGFGALLIRNVFRLIDSLPLCYVVGLVSCMLTERHVRLGDLVAGTVMVRTTVDASGSLERLAAQAQRGALPLEAVELVHDLLTRWSSLEPQQRARLARTVLSKLDPSADAADAALGETALQARLERLLEREQRS